MGTCALADEEIDGYPALLMRPQYLGFVPTYWFWRDREHYRSIERPFEAYIEFQMWIVMFGAWWFVDFYAAGAITVVSVVVAFGVVERALRARAMPALLARRRRRQVYGVR